MFFFPFQMGLCNYPTIRSNVPSAQTIRVVYAFKLDYLDVELGTEYVPFSWKNMDHLVINSRVIQIEREREKKSSDIVWKQYAFDSCHPMLNEVSET